MSQWDAAVVLLRRFDGKVLGVTRGSNVQDINLPGGNREPGDKTPVDTARRELMEETGLMVDVLDPIDSWNSNGKNVVAFRGHGFARGPLRLSSEGYPMWVKPNRLTTASSTYRMINKRLLDKGFLR